jgi:ParB family chromosome partitioning protein
MSKKEELGKGIRALLEGLDAEVAEKEKVGAPPAASANRIPLANVEVNPFQPRADFDEQRLRELAESIKVHGVIQPITVRRLNDQKFQLIAGERRLRAARMAGLKDIPAYVRTANDQEMLEIGLIENIQREDLNPLEIAVNYKRLMDECGVSQEQLGERVGKERSTVTNYLRLLKLPPEVQKGLQANKISMGHARALINVPNVLDQLDIYHLAVTKELSVRAVEDLVRRLSEPRQPALRKVKKLKTAFQVIQDDLASYLSTRVRLTPKKNGKGEIIVYYDSEDDLNRLLDLIEKP